MPASAIEPGAPGKHGFIRRSIGTAPELFQNPGPGCDLGQYRPTMDVPY
ncbi:hypothetical protein C4K39_0284 [Pseudomonas sessilinigenes]|nr:hypothetical protein C4K39_0284 [Pseudomonas sessilinigenes]